MGICDGHFTDTIIPRTVINTCLNDAHNGRVNWLLEVKHLLNRYGFLYVWKNPATITSTNVLMSTFKNTLIDVSIQEKRATITLVIYVFFIIQLTSSRTILRKHCFKIIMILIYQHTCVISYLKNTYR